MAVSALLERRGLSLAKLATFAPEVGAGETLALCGSVAEGIANAESDVDLLYIGQRNLKGSFVIEMGGVSSLDVAHDQCGQEVNVERLTPRELSDLGARFLPGLKAIENPRAGITVSLEHDMWRLKLLHRLRSAMVIHNPRIFASLTAPLRLDMLGPYLATVSLQWYLNAREDAWGEQQSGRLKSASYMISHIAAPRLLAALLASLGETNPDPKWHWLLANKHRDVVGPAILDPILQLIAGGDESDSPVRRFLDVAAPIEDYIYSRERAVYKAIVGFSRQARYYVPNA